MKQVKQADRRVDEGHPNREPQRHAIASFSAVGKLAVGVGVDPRDYADRKRRRGSAGVGGEGRLSYASDYGRRDRFLEARSLASFAR
jgi:hypothetical protein